MKTSEEIKDDSRDERFAKQLRWRCNPMTPRLNCIDVKETMTEENMAHK